MNAVNTARNTPGVVAVSMSWGFNEMANESSVRHVFHDAGGPCGRHIHRRERRQRDRRISGDISQCPCRRRDHAQPEQLGRLRLRDGWFDSGGGYSQYEREPSYQSPCSRRE